MCTLSREFLDYMVRYMPGVLTYLVDQDVEHNDIKPDNVLIGAGGFKLIDFGLANADTHRSRQSLSETPCYLPPELLDSPDDPPVPGCRDMFAFGVTLLFAMGFVPFPREHWIIAHLSHDLAARIKMRGWLEKLKAAYATIPENVTCFQRMLHPRPEQRIKAHELAARYQGFRLQKN